jgi:hypothetical protein
MKANTLKSVGKAEYVRGFGTDLTVGIKMNPETTARLAEAVASAAENNLSVAIWVDRVSMRVKVQARTN